MKKDLAESFELLASEFSRRLMRRLEVARGQSSEAEFKALARKVGSVLAEIETSIHRPIYEEHPDLKPRQLGGTYELPDFPFQDGEGANGNG
jgi:hypothetical protein